MSIPRPLAILIIALPWALAISCFVWLFLLHFPPSGIVDRSFVLDGTSPWFDPFLPAERVTQPGAQPDGWVGQRVLQDPVYASARVPGVYDNVSVGLELRTTKQPLAEFGILRDPATFSFEAHPLWSEELSHGWTEVTQGSTHGFVKIGTSPDILTHPDSDRVLTWDAASIPSTSGSGRMDHGSVERAWDLS